MTVVDQFASYKAIVQGSFENAVGTVERTQVLVADAALDILTELGCCPEARAQHLKDTHRTVLHTLATTTCAITDEFGDLIVDQVRVVLGIPKS